MSSKPDLESKPSQEEIARKLMEAFKRLNHLIHQSFARAMFPGSKPGQLLVMGMLRRSAGRGMRISDIAAAQGVTASSITQIVTDLEERGFAHRDMDGVDRRVVRVSITPEGEKAMALGIRPLQHKFEGLVERLGAERASHLVELLAEVDTFFREDLGPGEPSPCHFEAIEKANAKGEDQS